MKREIWEFLVDGRTRVIHKWLEDSHISPKDQAKLDVALDRLRTLDFGLVSSKLLAGPLRGSKIYKLRLRCQNRELRPMLCRGPLEPHADYSLLSGATETDSKLQPQDAVGRAEGNRQELIRNPKWRILY